MITPPYLKKGDKVGLVATARKVSATEMQPAIHQLEKWGLEVVEAPHLYAAYHQFAGEDEQRAADLQQMLDDKNIKAILCARGGYGTVRIIDRLDFTAFRKSPKWIIGYSDITVLHAHIQQNFGIETMHAVMPLDFSPRGFTHLGTQTLRDALSGQQISCVTAHHPLNREGSAKAEIVGGNLSILYSLTGTSSQLKTEGRILFMEDLDEYLYHIDRMMMNLKRSGMLSGLKGLIVGGMTRMNDNKVPFGKTAEQIIAEAVADQAYPVAFGFPAGHMAEQCALIMGRKATLKVDAKKSSLSFDKAGK